MCVSIHIIVWKGERYRERQRESGAQMSLEKTVGIIYTREREREGREVDVYDPKQLCQYEVIHH